MRLWSVMSDHLNIREFSHMSKVERYVTTSSSNIDQDAPVFVISFNPLIQHGSGTIS